MNTGQTVYEQLQEMVEQCIELGFIPDGEFGCIGCKCYPDVMEYIYYNQYLNTNVSKISYHELFSVESGLMEFVKWYDTLDGFEPNPAPHYIRMSMLTAEMKCNYFVKNAIIPTK